MSHYFTINNKVIPQNNIVKIYKKGTCDYNYATTCDRCCGKGFVHTYGVCFKCKGVCKIIKKSKGYNSVQLAIVVALNEKQSLSVSEQKITNKVSEQKKKDDRDTIVKKAMQLQLLITIGGSSSSFASSLAASIWTLTTTTHGKKLSDKQMTFVYKFLNQGCIIKSQPFDKIKLYMDSKI